MIDKPSQNAISSVVIFFQRSSVNARFALVKISQQESKHTPALEPYRILQGSLKRRAGGSNARVLHVSSSKPRAGYLFHFGGYIKVSIDLDFQQRENGGGLSEWCYTIASY